MVSFSCESCGDVLTKKKLDSHRNQCRRATFTCLDCMVHFRGLDYRSHTSCISEAQKYQGNQYKEKQLKPARKSVKISDPVPVAPHQAYVEDVPDPDIDNAVAVVDVPPAAPTPPSAVPPQPASVNVFDYLVTDETPNSSRVSLEGPKEQMKMVEHAPPVFDAGRRATSSSSSSEALHEYDQAYEENGYMYGTDPIPVQTPAPKALENGSRESLYELDASERKSTDKKRKRQQVEELDLTAARHSSQEKDHVMDNRDRPILHTGLTGGLNRLLSRTSKFPPISHSKFPPSPDYSGNDNNERSPPSPIKRPKQHAFSREARGRKTSSALVTIRKVSSHRRASDESRPRKHHRSHHQPDTHFDRDREPRRDLKAIEYHHDAESPHHHLPRAELFLSFVTKGPESGHGCSINKALKRYHRERADHGFHALRKAEEEKELWKCLRLRRNERGEVVLLFNEAES